MRKLPTIIALSILAVSCEGGYSSFPARGQKEVNVDTHIVLSFKDAPSLTGGGTITVRDAISGEVVDRLDMGIAPGPTEKLPDTPDCQYTPVPYEYRNERPTNADTTPGTPSGAAARDTLPYQRTIIGGFSDAFHFYPVIIHGNEATIYLHNNLLDYGRTYRVEVDGVFEGGRIRPWKFSTKASPTVGGHTIRVSPDGSADFSTLQGALDFVPDLIEDEKDGWTILLGNGQYEEIVYARNKNFLTIEGEHPDSVLVHYANCEVFNPHPLDIKTNEMPFTFPERRAATAFDNCSHLTLRGITFQTDCHGQAEGLLVNGDHIIGENLHIIGSGDALQANGSCLWRNCTIDGEGDTILGRGACFFENCTLRSYGPFMWIRNTGANHGNVFVDCFFKSLGGNSVGSNVIARLPNNHGKNYPEAECVLIDCTLEGVSEEGFGPVAKEAETAVLLETGSRDSLGNLLDLSRRHPVVRVLDPQRDKKLIDSYRDHRFVLGW